MILFRRSNPLGLLRSLNGHSENKLKSCICKQSLLKSVLMIRSYNVSWWRNPTWSVQGCRDFQLLIINKIASIIAYILRFSNNTKKPNAHLTGALSTQEIDSALTKWVYSCPQSYFYHEVKHLQSISRKKYHLCDIFVHSWTRMS